MDFSGNPITVARVVCPKPRRAGPSNYSNTMISSIFHMRNDADTFDSKPGAELLELILRKNCEAEQFSTVPSSPPFFFGSPPCRAPNPLAQDAHFGVQKPTSVCSSPSDSDSPPSTHARVKFGKKQAAVRVEGFDCQSSCDDAVAPNPFH